MCKMDRCTDTSSQRTSLDFNAASSFTQSFFINFFKKHFRFHFPEGVNVHIYHPNPTSFFYDPINRNFISVNIFRFLRLNPRFSFVFKHLVFQGIKYTFMLIKNKFLDRYIYSDSLFYQNIPVLASFFMPLRGSISSNSVEYETQGFFNSIFKTINFLGALSEKVDAFVETVKSDIIKPFISCFSSFIMALYRFISNLSNINFKTIVLDLLQMVVPLWTIWTDFPKISSIYNKKLEAQSFDFFGIIKALVGLPTDLESGLHRLYRIADEVNTPLLSCYHLIVDIFCSIVHLGVSCAEKHFPDSPFAINFRSFYQHLAFDSEFRRLSEKLAKFLVRYARDSSLIHSTVFRHEAANLHAILLTNTNFQKGLRVANNRSVANMWLELKGIMKSIESFSTSARTTPAFVILEGPPGCRKSTALGQITQFLSEKMIPNRSIYTHVWKAKDEGKDFYDDYNNQDVMVLDDVGQGGMGQWAKVMNFVSNVKMPLDCAEADKKNTKFFTSSAIICTTNNITGQLNITAQDGIADVNALRRRPLVFVFQAPVIVNGVQIHTVTARFFDFLSNTPAWKDGYPTDFTAFINSRPNPKPLINSKTGTLPEICAWITAMTLAMEDFHKHSFSYTQCTFGSDSVDAYYSQGIFSPVTSFFKKPPKSVSYKAGEDSVDIHSDLINDYVVFAPVDDDTTEDSFEFLKLITEDTVISRAIDRAFTYAEKTKVFIAHLKNTLSIESANFVLRLYNLFFVVKNWATKLISSFVSLISEHPILTAFISSFFILLTVGVVYLIKSLLKSKMTKIEQIDYKGFVSQGLNFSVDTDQSSSQYAYWIAARSNFGSVCSMAIFSGRRALCSRHSVYGCKVISAYKTKQDMDERKTLLDEVPFKVIFDSPTSDLCVIEFSIATNNLFKKASMIFHPQIISCPNNIVKSTRLVTPDGVVSYDNKQLRANEDTIAAYCDIYKKDIIYAPASGVVHPNGFKGLCGAVLYSPENGFLGTHVAGATAGSDEEKTYKGFIVLSSLNERKKITKLMLDCGDGLEIEPIQGSAARIRYPKGAIIPRNPLKESRLYETGAPFVEHESCKVKTVPVFVDEEGKSLLKEIVAPNLLNTGHVEMDSLDFGQKVIEQHFHNFKPIPWGEVIKGNDVLAPLNKDSVNGYGYGNDKTAYIDFENGTLDPEYEKYLDDLETRLISGNVEVSEMLAYHALKEEPRPKGKKPRTFAVMPLHMTLLFKKYFGQIMAYVKENRHVNGIAIGLNPYKEWTKVFNNLTSGNKKLMDADFGRWDRSLIAAFLDRVLASLRKFFVGTKREHKVLKALCDSLVRMFILVKDELYLITHGLQSGCWLTALLNSLINKLISGCTFYETYKSDDATFNSLPKRKADEERLNQFNRITEYFLGDDRISGVPPDLARYYNLRTIKPFVESLGMEITDGRKNPIDHEFVEPENASFLKRNFVVDKVDNKGKIIAPLSIDTLGNLFKFCDSSKDFKTVMSDRSVVFQIEKYLHKNNPLLDELEVSVKQWFDENDLVWKTLPNERIVEILSSDDGYNIVNKLNNKFYDY